MAERKIQAARKLIESGNDRDLFLGVCMLIEVRDDTPSALDPLALTLINRLGARIVGETERHLGVAVFENA